MTFSLFIMRGSVYFLGGALFMYSLYFSLRSFPGLEGMMTAIRTFLIVIITTLLSFIGAYVPSTHMVSLIAMYVCMSLFALISYLIFLRFGD